MPSSPFHRIVVILVAVPAAALAFSTRRQHATGTASFATGKRHSRHHHGGGVGVGVGGATMYSAGRGPIACFLPRHDGLAKKRDGRVPRHYGMRRAAAPSFSCSSPTLPAPPPTCSSSIPSQGRVLLIGGEGGSDRVQARDGEGAGDGDYDDDASSFEELCHLVGAEPGNLLRLDRRYASSDSDFLEPDGIRGVYLNRPVPRGDVVLSIPLTSCLRDDEPPEWMSEYDDMDEDRDSDSDGVGTEGGAYYYHSNPSEWATRLAASLLDERLNNDGDNDGYESDDEDDRVAAARRLWFSLLPDPDFLRASLPIHWSEDVLRSAQCTALELAVDSAYFAREQAVSDLMHRLSEARDGEGSGLGGDGRDDFYRRACEDALDAVQTRSCRVEFEGGTGRSSSLSHPASVRLLAPVFDMINHAASASGVNAAFGLEYGRRDGREDRNEPRLVVRAVRDIGDDEELLIDYGASARPAWKCLSSYGFVPTYEPSSTNDEYEDDEYDDDDGDTHVAEVYMDGVRYEVGPSTIPTEIVAAMTAATSDPDMYTERFEEAEITLTPDVALHLAQRLSVAAFQMLMHPVEEIPLFKGNGRKKGSDEEDYDDEEGEEIKVEDVLSSYLASKLRWNQHRILLKCSMGLRDWAVANDK